MTDVQKYLEKQIMIKQLHIQYYVFPVWKKNLKKHGKKDENKLEGDENVYSSKSMFEQEMSVVSEIR